MRRYRSLFILALFFTFACTTPPPAITQPELTFAHQAPIRLAIGAVEIDHRFTPPMRAPHVEHVMPTPPMQAAARWAKDRLHAAGGTAKARFVILDAKVTEEKLPTTGGLRGYFTVDQELRYSATLHVRLDILDEQGNRLGFAEATAFRDRTVPENASVNAREDVWFRLTEALLQDFDSEMQTAIRTHLTAYRAHQKAP